MRVGDTYKIKRMIIDGHDDKAILARFENDYGNEETQKFIKHIRGELAPKKVEVESKTPAKAEKKSTPKKDPLG